MDNFLLAFCIFFVSQASPLYLHAASMQPVCGVVLLGPVLPCARFSHQGKANPGVSPAGNNEQRPISHKLRRWRAGEARRAAAATSQACRRSLLAAPVAELAGWSPSSAIVRL